MESAEFTDEVFVRTLAASGARALIIGRKALVLLGAPVLTADFDVWLHIDDIEKLNAAFAPLDHYPSRPPDEARRTGRYVLENGERVDVLVARSNVDPAGARLSFEDAWARRQTLEPYPAVSLALPCLDDLISTKRWGGRARDIADIEYLEAVRRVKGER